MNNGLSPLSSTSATLNHWSDPRLKRGAGVGIRWYSMLGAVRLDAAQGLDIPGKPWEIYLTIGTPLL